MGIMANEAVCIETPKIIKRYTVLDANAITYGAILVLSGGAINTAMTSSTAHTVSTPFAGIAIEEKTASDGITEIGAAIDGVWDIKWGIGASVVGDIVCLSGANLVRTAIAGDLINGAAFGKVLEPAAGSSVSRVRVGLV